jgi:site-specific DNA-methyltransferase (adenine-specific)
MQKVENIDETPAFAKHVLPAVPLSEVYLEDCVKALKRFNDNHFDLAIVDPPYGIERFKKPSGTTRFKSSKLMQEEGLTWDIKPTDEYWDELFRVSKNQIVFGANNFTMPPSEYFLIWDKAQTVDNFATAEYAWVSMGLKKPAKIYRYSIHKHNHTDKIHPTQKPIDLYRWILQNYAEEGNLILDTHLGSGSSRLAAFEGGFNFVGFEIDQEYYEKQEKRFNDFKSQLRLF